MSGCNEHKDKLLQDYFLDRLTSEEMGEFQYHLLHCEACRDRLKKMRGMAAGWDDADLVLNEWPETNRGTNYSFRIFTRIAVVAGLALLLIGGGYYFMSIPADTGLPIEVNEAPVFHSSDSIAVDSMAVDTFVDSIDVQPASRYTQDEE